ncbi:MAG: hypothetical protein ABEJ70_03255 [Halobacteriaceae archaeon]
MVAIPSKYADEVGPGLVVLVGFVLFVIPEPLTSTIGAGLLLFGSAWWFYEWQRP